MLELIGSYDIFKMARTKEAICVTTNGQIRADGRAVMGRGVALQADQLFNLAPKLANYLTQYGNRCFNMGAYEHCGQRYNVITFPTKHHWKDKSDINLICKSCRELVQMCDKFGFTKCYLTPPGCGNGGLNYAKDVRPYIASILDDRFIVILPSEGTHYGKK